VFECFHTVLNEGKIGHPVQYMIEVLMQVRKDKFRDHPVIPAGLATVEEDDQITHCVALEDELQVQEVLSGFFFRVERCRVLTVVKDIFKFDPNYLANEEKYCALKTEILGDDEEGESGDDSSDGKEDDKEVSVFIWFDTICI